MPVYYESRKNKRNTNQDYCFSIEYRINHEAKIKAFLLADGMGGLACGDQVSSMAGEKWLLKLQKCTLSHDFLGQSLNKQIQCLKDFSYQVVDEINQEIYRELFDQGIKGGTTLTTGVLFWNTMIIANCGDSPAYYYNRKEQLFRKVSQEQNMAEEMLREGKVKKDSLEYIRYKHMLTDYVGKYRPCVPHVESIPFYPGDKLLLGSDGAFGNLEEAQIGRIVSEEKKDPNWVIKEIMSAAESMGEEDNQTMIFYVEDMDKEPEGKHKPKEKKKSWKLF